jgi:hemerythrin-like domain-containing protein
MIHTLLILEQEHQNLAKLLRLMRTLSDEISDGQAPDINLLNEIGDYISGYPEICHHPKEDLIFRRLQEKYPEVVETGADLLAEHEGLSKLIDSFNSSLKSVSADPTGNSGDFARCMNELVDAYEHHMEMEEKHFFPTSRSKLNADDWAAIDFAVSDQDDPLFDEATTKYAKIRDEIFRAAEKHDERSSESPQDAPADMSALVSVGQFNAIMGSRGLTLRLAKMTDGSFDLDDDGRVLIKIPVCSEARAVWCAHCFVMGRDFR